MIKNERQLGITGTQIENFKKYLTLIEQRKVKRAQGGVVEAEERLIRSQIKKLEDEVTEYKSLWKSNTPIRSLERFDEVPSALIRARISAGLSQKDLAERLGLKEQQIQRYEATEYETASLARIMDLIQALGLNLTGSLTIPSTEMSLGSLINKLGQAGIEKKFIIDRLLPPRVTSQLEEGQNSKQIPIDAQTTAQLARIFHWSPNQIYAVEPLRMDQALLGGLKFKKRKNASESLLTVHAFYCQYVAMLVLQGTSHLPTKKLPTHPYEINKSITHNYGSITVQNALRYVWSFGTPVISLNDSGGFQALRFYESGRSAIVIKEKVRFHANWLFHLFHEIYHAEQSQGVNEILHVEDFELKTDSDSSEDEKTANLFASAVLLGPNSSKIVKMCVEEATYDEYKLKAAVQRIAAQEKVPVDLLASSVAFTLSEQGRSWWGTANSLQEPKDDIHRIARDILLEYIDLTQLSGPDLDLLRRALGFSEGN